MCVDSSVVTVCKGLFLKFFMVSLVWGEVFPSGVSGVFVCICFIVFSLSFIS